MANIEDLKKEAEGLGITFNAKIGEAKLKEKIDQHYENLAAESSVEVIEDVNDEVEVEDVDAPAVKRAKGIQEIARELKKLALVKKVVTITSNDQRDNHVADTCYLACENQFWGISKIVPLNIAIELEQCLIDTADSITIARHVDEIIDGKRTGNKTVRNVKKYVISYAQ